MKHITIYHTKPIIANGIANCLITVKPKLEVKLVANTDSFLSHIANNEADIIFKEARLIYNKTVMQTLREIKPLAKIVSISDGENTCDINEVHINGLHGCVDVENSTAEILQAITVIDGGNIFCSSASLHKAKPLVQSPILLDSEPHLKYNIKELTKRENEVAWLLFDNKSHKEIADKLSITISSVSTHIKHIYQKLNVHKINAFLKLMAVKLASLRTEQNRTEQNRTEQNRTEQVNMM